MNHSEQPILISVNQDNFSFIYGCALRYALGRKTYVASILTEFSLIHMEQFGNNATAAMIHDIEIQKDFRDDAYCDERDNKLWLDLLEHLKKHLPQAQ